MPRPLFLVPSALSSVDITSIVEMGLLKIDLKVGQSKHGSSTIVLLDPRVVFDPVICLLEYFGVSVSLHLRVSSIIILGRQWRSFILARVEVKNFVIRGRKNQPIS